MSHPLQSRYAFARHPAQLSSVPSTLTAQMPRAFVRAAPFTGSRLIGQTISNMEAKSRVQDLTEEMEFKPISKQGRVPDIFSLRTRVLAPPTPPTPSTQIADVDAIEAEAMMGKGMRKLKKGSPDMKAHMAKLRGMRKK